MFSWTSTHTSFYATVRSLGLPRIRHATLLYVLLDFHAYVMLRYCTFSWTSTHTSCYATVCPLGLPRIRHATLLYVLLDLHTYVMLRHCVFSWTSTHTSCYATVSLWKLSCQLTWFWNATSVAIALRIPPCHNMCSCGAGDQACRIQSDPDQKVLGRTWNAAVNKRRPQNCENELVGGFEENPNMEISRRRNDCFHFSAWNQGVHGLHTKIARILIGTSTSNMINNIPWLKNTRPSKGRALSYSTTPWITPGKDTKSGTGANVPTCCWRGRGLGRDFLLPVLKVGLLSYPATKSYHTANNWTHTANPLMNPYQALIPCATGCRRATMASLPGPDLGTEACGSTGTEASASSAGATGSGTTGEASGTSCLGIWGVHWPKLMKNDGNDVQ